MATNEFLEGWRQATGGRYLLAKIEIPRLSVVQTDTLYVAESEVGSYPDTIAGGFGKLWQSVVKLFEDVRMPGAYGSTDVPAGASGLQLLADRVVTFPAGAGPEIQSTLRASMATHLWDSARVTFYRYIHELGDFQHAQQFFKGDVIEVGLDGPLLMLKLQQRVDWNTPLSLESVNRQRHPRAPEEAVGLPLQVLYGQLQARPLRSPWALGTGVRNKYSMIALGNSRVNPALLVDKGRGGQAANNLKSVVLCAGHPVKSVAAYADRTAMWHDGTDGLCLLDDGQIELLNDATGAGVKLPESGPYAWVRLRPTDIIAQSNECDNARSLFEPNDLSFAHFDYAANRRNLSVQFAGVPELAASNAPTVFLIGYQSSSDLAGFKVRAGVGIPAAYIHNPLPVSTAPDILSTAVLATNGWVSDNLWQIDFFFEGGFPAGSVKVYFACLAVNFRPRQDVIMSSERRIATLLDVSLPDRRGGGARTRYRPFQTPVLTPPYTELRGKFFGNQQGYKDDGSGTYSGTPNALIERMPDIARHLLTTSGGQDATELDAASFNAARPLLVDQLGNTLSHGLVLAEQVNVGQMLDSLCSDALAQVRVSPYDDKLKLHVWRRHQTTDYPWKFSRYDILEPQGPNCSRLPVSQLVTGVRVAYDYDQRERTCRSEATLAFNKSVAGHEYRNLRDEYMSVVAATNDRLNWKRAGVAYVATLAAADYDPGPLALEVQNKMKAADTGANYWCAHGGTVTSNCCKITFTIFAVAYTVNISLGTWNMEQLATQATVAMNSIGPGGFSVSYSRATRKFTIANGTSFSLRWCAGLTGDVPDRATALLGYTADATGTIHTSTFEVEEGRFAIVAAVINAGANAPIDLNFKSGPDGTDSAVSVRHCADVLGYDPTEDKLVVFNALGAWAGDCPKGARERNMRAVADRFKDGLLRGARRELAYQARTIYNTRTARALRNRIADLFARPEPPTIARFSTYHAPDIEIGNVFEFLADLDELQACPVLGSGGSWVGQGFVVTEYAHRNGPTSRATEIVGVEA